VHPIERLRYVARATGADQGALVRETAGALAAFRHDPAGLVTGCRRIVARHPASGPLWWLCARVLTAADPMAEAWRAADELDADRTGAALAGAIADDATVCVLGWPETVGEVLPRRGDLDVLVVDALGQGSGLVHRLTRNDVAVTDVPAAGLGAAAAHADLVLLEADAVGPDAAVAVAGSRAAAAVAHHAGVPVWLVAGVGRLVPRRVWDSVVSRLDAATDPWDADGEVVPLGLVDRLVGPGGPEPVATGLRRTDCPIAAELLREI
jgi:translation initiation factor 2B subunit (eIF-2B alpha/beta/delta family)